MDPNIISSLEGALGLALYRGLAPGVTSVPSALSPAKDLSAEQDF